VIVDDKFSTYGILGVAEGSEGDSKVLIFDPHMHVKKTMTIEDFEEQSATKGGWRAIKEHFKKKLWMVYYPLGSGSTMEDRHNSRDCGSCILS